MHTFQQAYTLFEVLVALAIIAISSAIFIPGLQDFINTNNDTILQAQILQAIQLAKQETQTRNEPISICKSNNSEKCADEWADRLLVFMDEKENGIVQDRQHIISVVQLKPRGGKINWHAYPFYRDYLHFTSSPYLSADNGMFWYCRAKNKVPVFAITLSKSGRTHLVYPDKQGQIKDSRGRNIFC